MYIRYNLLLIKLVVSVSNNAMQSCYLSKKEQLLSRGNHQVYICVETMFPVYLVYVVHSEINNNSQQRETEREEKV